MTKQEKIIVKYAVKIMEAVLTIFEEESENYIEIKDDELTEFIHALGNAVPTKLYNTILNENKDWIGFNHIANRLCYQFSAQKEMVKKRMALLDRIEKQVSEMYAEDSTADLADIGEVVAAELGYL